MQPDPSSDFVVAQTAADWVARHDRGLTPAERVAFETWRSADVRHAREFARLKRTWNELDGTRAVPELAAMAEAIVLRARDSRDRRRMRRVYTAGLAAAAVIAIGSWLHLGPARRGAAAVKENYRVLASTVQRTTLSDGTIAELNGDSRIEVDFTADERRVRLIQGEGHFIVAKNPARPFFVTAGPVTVRAVGTAFNVRLASASVEVLVTEGQVKLEKAAAVTASAAPRGVAPLTEPAGLVMGQRAVINLAKSAVPADVAIGDVGQAEINDTLGWQSTRLVFNNTPLDEVVAGFNHYNSHRLTLGDVRLRQRTVTGIFRADNLDGFIRLLKPLVDVRAEPRGATETVLLPAR